MDFLTEAGVMTPYGNTYKLIRAALDKMISFEYLEALEARERQPALQRMMDHHFPDDTTEDDTPSATETRMYAQNLRLSNQQQPRSITLPELEQIIDSLGCKKAPGLDHITANMIKKSGSTSLQLFLKILNNSIETAYFADEWQQGEVIFIPKGKGKDTTQISSYRPITLLPIMGKIFERIIKTRIEEFAHPQKLLGENHLNIVILKRD